MKINLREHLNKLDVETDNRYDLRNLYDSYVLTESQKVELVKKLNEGIHPKEVYNYFMDICEGKTLPKKAISKGELKEKITDTIKKFIVRHGYEDDFMDYITVSVTDDESVFGKGVKAEVRTELDYDEMQDLVIVLDRLISKYDSRAYFDYDTNNIVSAWLFNTANSDDDDELDDTFTAIDDLYNESLNEDSEVKEYSKLRDNPKGIADKIRKNKLNREVRFDDNVNYSAKDKHYSVQFQDVDSNTNEIRQLDDGRLKQVNRQPKVKSHSWGRVWKDGDLVANVKGPKYKVRADIAKELDKDEPFATGKLAYEESLEESASEGNVFTKCANCGKTQKVKVTFPAFNKPFEETTYTCINCGEENTLTDNHEYNDDGTIKENLERDLDNQYVVKGSHKSMGKRINKIATSEFVKSVIPVVKYDTEMFEVTTNDDEVYTLLPISLSQVNVYDSKEELVDSHVFISDLDDEIFNKGQVENVYKVVGGEYEGDYTLDELKNLPIFSGKYFNHRGELNNQPILDGYVGPMLDGWREGHKRVIRYDTYEIYDMLSR